MDEHEKTTAPSPSVSADGEQSNAQECNFIISDSQIEHNLLSELLHNQRRLDAAHNPNYIYSLSLTELLDKIVKQKETVIENLIHTGIYILAGAPKIGKSFLAAQICYHISEGTPLWDMRVQQSRVYYLALEDNIGRLQCRFSEMYGLIGNDNLHISTTAKPLGQGLEEQLRYFVQTHPDTKLIVIDTLQKIRGADNEKMSYANDYEAIGKLKVLTDELSLCIILIHHTRKQSADDIFDTISGTNGLTGAVDGSLVLYKNKRIDDTAILEITGRDQADQRLHLSFNRQNFIWTLVEVEAELFRPAADPLLEKIVALLKTTSPWIGNISQLATAISATIPSNQLSRKLNIAQQRLYEEYGIIYANTHTKTGSQISLRLKENH